MKIPFKNKIVTLKLELDFETNGKEITWVGSGESIEDQNGKELNMNDLPSVELLLTHYLGKQIQGLNDDDELAIVNEID